MGFRINTNIGALSAHTSATANNRSLDNSLSALSSGLRINKSADDSSGMAIADSLRTQASSLTQAIANANDAIGIIQTADKAMDEQLKILDTIKAKSIQAASDSQSVNSRAAIQKDVNRLLEQLDNIARTTAFNGQALLSGKYLGREFQIGAYSNQTVKVDVQNTQAVAIGRITKTEDHTVIGNTLQAARSAGHSNPTADFKSGTKEFYLADLKLGAKGLGKGDTIKFVGDDTAYVVDKIEVSTSMITLQGGLEQDMKVGTQLYVVDNTQAVRALAVSGASGDGTTATIEAAGAVTAAHIDFSTLKGVARGDIISFTTSSGVSGELQVKAIDMQTGAISLAAVDGVSTGDLGADTIFQVKESATFDNGKFKLTKDSAAASDNIQIQASAGSTGGPADTAAALATGAFDGLAVGDRVTIGDNKQVLTIKTISVSEGKINFNEKLDEGVKIGDKIEVVENASEIKGYRASAAQDAESMTISAANLLVTGRGIAKGDFIQTTLSNGDTISVEVKNVAVTSEGIALSFGGTILDQVGDQTSLIEFSTKFWDVKSSSTLGEDFTSSDYARYTVEGIQLEAVQMTDTNGNGVANTGLGEVANKINEVSDRTNLKAVADVSAKGEAIVKAGTINRRMTINGETILEKGTKLLEGDTNKRLVDAINAKSGNTGVTAAIDNETGVLTLKSDGRAMNLKGFTTTTGINDGVHAGKLVYTQQDTSAIEVTAEHFQDAALTKSNNETAALSVRNTTDNFNLRDIVTKQNEDGTAGLLRTRNDAMTAMNIVETAIRTLDDVRADLGAVQNQFVVTINNISVTRVNVQAAESQIRDVDFASESANFSKFNILAQSGSYAMSQANAIQQNVLRLLQ